MLRHSLSILAIGSLSLAPLTSCESLPGDEGTQGAVIGGLGGAVAGAAVAGDDDRLIGALLGGALGAGGGYLIGTQLENADEDDRDEALEANRKAQEEPVSVDAARDARTADIDDNGYVTLDEVVAMEKAGLSDDQIITRLERTDMFFELTDAQEDYLRDRGVSRRVIDEMQTINADAREAAAQRLSR